MDHLHELEPLEAGDQPLCEPHLLPPQKALHLPPLRHSRLPPRCLKAPLRVCRLMALLVLLPTLLIMLPLYMRYRVFSSQMYPMSMTDMRLIDGKVSPTWCQRQVVRSNSTFNAFVVPGPPEMASELVPVSMTRQITLQADMKEYWGFYLLQGSEVTVEACVRWPGASLIMIRGYKHLQECAYIGDNSSEEMDELYEAEKLGLIDHETVMKKLAIIKKEEGKANQPGTMKRHKAGVSFHDPNKAENVTSLDPGPDGDVTDHDPKELREILERLHAVRQAIKDKAVKDFKLPPNLVSVAELHRFRDTNVDRNEQKWLTFKDLDKNNSTEAKINQTRVDMAKANTLKEQLITTTTEHIATTTVDTTIPADGTNNAADGTNTAADSTNTLEESDDRKLNENPDIILVKLEEEAKMQKKSTNKDQLSAEIEQDSKEIFEDVLKRLQALGERGKRVLKKLHESMGMMDNIETPSSIEEDIMNKVTGSSEELDQLRRVLVEAIDEEKMYSVKKQKSQDAKERARTRRQLVLGKPSLQQSLNEDDEARDYAAEEGLEPDGYAEDHTVVNETSPLDMSNSEFWSSFSSSEEALLECDGLILNLPLTPHAMCEKDFTAEQRLKAAQSNALTYRVPANGYYFFVFNSENEVQDNHISVKFSLQKTRYDVARTALRQCKNSTDKCELLLDIFSSQKVVLELPLRNNESLWNEQFVVISECEPRTSIYLVCAISVPLLIVMFAFQ